MFEYIYIYIYIYVQSGLPPLMPKVDAILVLDGDGNRLAGKYYGDFLKNKSNANEQNDLRLQFEKVVHTKISTIGSTRIESGAEIVTVQNKTVVFCGGMSSNVNNPNDCIRIVHVGPNNESELVMAYLCEGMYDALSQLMGGSCDRTMVLDNLELVFLLIDEHCDGGIILEVDGHKLASAVLLRDDTDPANQNHPSGGGNNANDPTHGGLPVNHYNNNVAEMSIGQALLQARDQFMAGMNSRDGM
jgi:coatomer subunit zeta